jgi:hypothetical protein
MSGEVTDLTRGIYRRVYSGFIKGQRINQIPLEAEAWFWRILAAVDDFGNMEADPLLFHAATAGRRVEVSSQTAATYLMQIAGAKLVEFYEAKGEYFLHVKGFEEMQPAGKNGRRIRRCPIPDESQKIQGIPDVVSASDNEDDNEDDNEKVAHAAKPRSPSKPKLCDEDYVEELQNSEAYNRLNVRHVLAKMVVWCENTGKQPTRSRLLNWLSREDRPIAIPKVGKTATTPAKITLPRWNCECGFYVLAQNGTGPKTCPECGKGLTRESDATHRVSAG